MSLAELPTTAPDDAFDWPLFGLQDDVRPALASAIARRSPVVLATLYGVVGGAPRGIGAQMAFVDGTATGFLSGGCVEADLALHAREVLSERRPRRLVYGEGGPLDVQLPCGSRIEVLLEAIGPDDPALRRLLQLTGARRPALWLTDGERRYCTSVDDAEGAPAPFGPIAALAAGDAACGSLDSPFAVFRTYFPPVRLIAVGSDPIAMAVVKLAVDMGLDTVLIRPKGPETCPLPGVVYLRDEVDEALIGLRPDRWTAVALLTHDTGQEREALAAALHTEAGYIGALGSRRRIPGRNALLRASGFGDADIGRVRAPIGLRISGKSPWEIAVSVIAEVIDEMARR